MVVNLGDVIWKGANGVLIEPVWAAAWGVIVLLTSEWGNCEWNSLQIPKGVKKYVKLRHGRKQGETFYATPQSPVHSDAGSVMGFGKTVDAAREMCKNVFEQIQGFDLDAALDDLDKVEDKLAESKEYGVEI